jgi:hypothetical protein
MHPVAEAPATAKGKTQEVNMKKAALAALPTPLASTCVCDLP